MISRLLLFLFIAIFSSPLLHQELWSISKDQRKPAPRYKGFKINLPLKCKMGQDCFIQNYFDVNQKNLDEPYRDYTCGHLSFPGHTGTDFRVKTYSDMLKGVDVVAVESGKVIKVTDGEDDSPNVNRGDILPRKFCGNGVTIRHQGNWITRYCHMKKDSITVHIGQNISKGQKLGQIGMTGMAQFPHVHLTIITPDRRIIDPFTGLVPNNHNKCKKENANTIPDNSLWSEKAKSDLQPLVRTGIISSGIGTKKITKDEAMLKSIWNYKFSPIDPKILLWVKVFGVKKGDIEVFKVWDPNNRLFLAIKKKPIYKDKALWFSVVGRKRAKGKMWIPGKYKVEYLMIRKNRIITQLHGSFTVKQDNSSALPQNFTYQ